MNDLLTRLLALAEADESLRTLDGRLSDLDREEEHLRERLAHEDEAFRRRQEEHCAVRLAALAKSGEVDATDEKIRIYQRRLDHDIIPYKEMEHLREQVTYLRGRLDALTEEALRLMGEADADEGRLKVETADHAGRRGRLEGELGALARRRAEIQAEEENVLAKRGDLSERVPPHLRQHYERLRGGGRPVVPVEGGACGGCHLRLAEATVAKLKADREAVTCEHCSRFLYLRPY
jgi:predicted  nucleic acid-binding Zn-ribbon protein